MGYVVVREYDRRFLAQQAAGLLEEAGIPSSVQSDDLGGALPQLGLGGGYRVQVKEEDLKRSEEVLEVLGPYTPPKHKGFFN